jgi:3-methylfumaryl-CoA hydratase
MMAEPKRMAPLTWLILLNITANLDEMKQWLGKVERTADEISLFPLRALAATLDCSDRASARGDSIPPCAHWLYFLPVHRLSEVGSDGHARRGGFLPPVPLPRRMWAGSRIEFLQPLRVGESVANTRRIVDVSCKEGRSGPLVFVRVRHEIENSTGLAVIEEQDIVYRDQPKPGEVSPASPPISHRREWARQIEPDALLLFRFSALTFNGHRIHYDRPYANGAEGYPGLVVHSPLTATLLLDLLHRNLPHAELAHFSFRAVKPLFDTTPFLICGGRGEDPKTVHLWAEHLNGALAMAATATLR